MLNFIRFFTFERQVILFVVSLVLSIVLLITSGIAWAWMPLIFVIFLPVKHFLIGTVNGAAMKMQMGDLEGAEKTLKYVVKPSWLQFGYHGMFYFLKSSIALQKSELKKAENLANKALALKLPDDMKAMAYLQLININGMYQKQYPQNKTFLPKIKELLQKAKKLNVQNSMIRDNITEVSQMLKGEHEMQKKMATPGKGGNKSMMQQGFMKRGGGKKRK